jgi:hypothetical protein
LRAEESVRGQESLRRRKTLSAESIAGWGILPSGIDRQTTPNRCDWRHRQQEALMTAGKLLHSAPVDRPRDPSARTLSAAQRRRMLDAGAEIRECWRVLAKGGLNIVGEVLRGQGQFVEFDHYPAGDVFDDETGSQYYYHAHRDGEHGHFHTFLRARGMPEGMSPLPYAGATEAWPEGKGALSHLIAISMDRYGFPIGLFATNRWVTAETWYRCDDVIRMLDRFSVDHAFPSWPVNRWITAMAVLFRPHIELLLRHRDAVIAHWRQRAPDGDVFEDRDLETTGYLPIDVEGWLREVAAARGP